MKSILSIIFMLAAVFCAPHSFSFECSNGLLKLLTWKPVYRDALRADFMDLPCWTVQDLQQHLMIYDFSTYPAEIRNKAKMPHPQIHFMIGPQSMGAGGKADIQTHAKWLVKEGLVKVGESKSVFKYSEMAMQMLLSGLKLKQNLFADMHKDDVLFRSIKQKFEMAFYSVRLEQQGLEVIEQKGYYLNIRATRATDAQKYLIKGFNIDDLVVLTVFPSVYQRE